MLIFRNQIHNQLDHHQNHPSTQNHLHPCLPLTFSPDSRISIYNWKNRWKWPFSPENATIFDWELFRIPEGVILVRSFDWRKYLMWWKWSSNLFSSIWSSFSFYWFFKTFNWKCSRIRWTWIWTWSDDFWFDGRWSWRSDRNFTSMEIGY